LIAPDVFDVSDEGVGQVLVDSVPEENLADVEEAVESCPEAAIRFSA
jgi:ferredoxin